MDGKYSSQGCAGLFPHDRFLGSTFSVEFKQTREASGIYPVIHNDDYKASPNIQISKSLSFSLKLHNKTPQNQKGSDLKMADIAADSTTSTTTRKEIEELNESRAELYARIQGLKKDLQTWRSKLDSQVKVYRDELSEIKQSLNTEVEQLRSEFQELRTSLQQQQDDVANSLRNFGREDAKGNSKADQLTLEGNKESDASPNSEVDD